ncbi:MAG: PQQ-dependent sugar dehydrogenase [Candidatus Levybacteria bacterium]|nr:PQQ-dependent sugar dehydrogenase [Candidatus Levybacteria bacterium]
MKKLSVIGVITLLIVVVIAGKFLITPLSKSTPKLSVQNDIADQGTQPTARGGDMPFTLSTPEGYTVKLFANNITNARDLYFTPDGTLLVSSSGTGNVYALPDKNSDGIADEVISVVSGLDQPHGLAMINNKLYIAETRRVSRFSFDTSSYKAAFEKELFKLPGNTNHNKRTIVFDENSNLYTSVGSTCNVCEEKDAQSGTVLISDSEGNNLKVFSKGVRNAPFLAINPTDGALWSTGMGRDLLGDDLPPDEINILKSGGDYGWPYCYGDKVFDANFNKMSSSYCSNTVAPAFQIPAHSAPLGLAFIPANFSSSWVNDILVAYHGSWNRSIPDGYKVVKLEVSGTQLTSSEDFLTGFIQNGSVVGRPVDVVFDQEGYAYVSDDKTGNIYIISQVK